MAGSRFITRRTFERKDEHRAQTPQRLVPCAWCWNEALLHHGERGAAQTNRWVAWHAGWPIRTAQQKLVSPAGAALMCPGQLLHNRFAALRLATVR